MGTIQNLSRKKLSSMHLPSRKRALKICKLGMKVKENGYSAMNNGKLQLKITNNYEKSVYKNDINSVFVFMFMI